MTLWTAADAMAAIGGTGPLGWRAEGISIDTRTLVEGDLFVALEGPNFDGHDFLPNAFAAGAVAAVVSRADRAESGALIQVEDTLQALGDLGRAARQRTQARILAITGSVGKTGAVQALVSALEVQGVAHASAHSYNNHWGVPLSLARMASGSNYGLFEIGMNHAGEIGPLSHMVSPHVALITNVEAAHLAAFNSIEEVAAAKAEIFSGLQAGGTAVINRDNAHYEQLREAADAEGVDHFITFGGASDADVRLLKMGLHGECSCVRVDVMGERITYKLGAPGRYLVMNSLGWLACLKALGADLTRAALQWAGMRIFAGRGLHYIVDSVSGRFTLVDESYNANPASMVAAIETLGRARVSRQAKRIAVLGDMMELGATADDWHRRLAPTIEQANVDLVFTCGPHMRNLYEALPSRYRGGHGVDATALVPIVQSVVGAGDVVMVKGSHDSRMSIVVQSLRSLEGGALLFSGDISPATTNTATNGSV
ncbi:MAG: UDP-N-acetylmuramoylalanyl-D-glutamyl-2,6-diaminopimelate--D-alanyl-D-alanine ligase [Parvularculales bacterium]